MRIHHLMVPAISLAIASIGTFANAAILLQDNFDSYADQAAFQAAWPAVGAQPSGTLSTAQAASSPNSVLIGLGTATADSPRNGRSFAESGLPSPTNVIRFSFDFFDSDAAAAPYRNFANLQDSTAASGSGQLIALGLNNTLSAAGGNYYHARILGFNSGAFFKLDDGGASTLRSTGWHNLAVEISDTNFTFFVDGILAKTVPNTYTLRSYDHVRLGAGFTSARIAYYDNVLVQTFDPTEIPEPSTIALTGLALVGLTFAARRRVR